METVSAALQKLEAWQASTRELLIAVPELEQLRELVVEGEVLPAVVPELASVTDLLKKAEDWLARCAAHPSHTIPLRTARTLLHAGERIGVKMPQVRKLCGGSIDLWFCSDR